MIIFAHLFLLLGCNPWTGPHERELIWYDAERVEKQLGIDLVSLAQGGPFSPRPRLIVQTNKMVFDNRAWFFQLPEAFFTAPTDSAFFPSLRKTDERLRFLIENELVTTLNKGEIPDTKRQENNLLPLSETLRLQLERMKYIHAQFPEHIRSDAQIALIFEPNIPLKTVLTVTYTVVQANVNDFVYAGRYKDKIRGVLVKPVEKYKENKNQLEGIYEDRCDLFLAPGKAWLQCPAAPPLAVGKNCSVNNWQELYAKILSLQTTCAAKRQDNKPITLWAKFDSQITFADFVAVTSLGFKAYPNIIQQEFPMIFPTKENPNPEKACENVIQFAHLSLAQMDYLCLEPVGKESLPFTQVFPNHPAPQEAP